jgi:hypothetical protein
MITGWPLTSTRRAGTSHLVVTHGCGFVPVPIGTWNGHPATGYVSAIVAAGWPPTRTRVLELTTVTDPACGQTMLAPTWTTGPGITPPPADAPTGPLRSA